MASETSSRQDIVADVLRRTGGYHGSERDATTDAAAVLDALDAYDDVQGVVAGIVEAVIVRRVDEIPDGHRAIRVAVPRLTGVDWDMAAELGTPIQLSPRMAAET